MGYQGGAHIYTTARKATAMARSLGVALAGILLVLFGALAFSTGVIQFGWPSLVPDITTVEVTISTPEAPRITAIRPIRISCQARVFAEVPVSAERRYQVVGRTYRTDVVTMRALGDVDTCVDSSGVKISYNDDGTAEVVIDAASIRLERPRVDTVRTAATVVVDKGLVGRIVDVFPWIDEDMGLTPAAYAYAQNVIGGSECSETAWALTRDLVIEGYKDQVRAQAVPPEMLTVVIDGEPTFPEPAPLELGGATMSTGEVTCSVGGRPQPGQD